MRRCDDATIFQNQVVVNLYTLGAIKRLYAQPKPAGLRTVTAITAENRKRP
jgi:hypothetical protein